MVTRKFYSDRDLDNSGVLTRSTRYRLRRQGKFPEPICLSAGRKAYPAELIDAWIAERMGQPHAA